MISSENLIKSSNFLEKIGNIISEEYAHYTHIFVGYNNGPFEIDEDEMEKVEFFTKDFLKKELQNPDELKLTNGCQKALKLFFEK